MMKNSKITIPELSVMIGINEANIQKNVRKLRELGKIERVGPAKGGYWKILG